MKRLLPFLITLIAIIAVFHIQPWKFIASHNPSFHPPSSVSPTSPLVTKTPEEKVGIPQELIIPKFGIHAPLETVGLDAQGRMDVPKNPEDGAWYSLGYKPGEIGSAVIDGHLDTPTGAPAIFWNIGKLTQGDMIEVTDFAGKTYTFIVTKTTSFPYNQVPLQEIFATHDKPRLNLITCAGTWDRTNHNYSNRTVVYAQLQ